MKKKMKEFGASVLFFIILLLITEFARFDNSEQFTYLKRLGQINQNYITELL